MNLVDHQDPAYPQEPRSMDGLAEACHISLPIWAKQIETASTQATTATDALTRQFADLTINLDSALAASRPAGDETMATGDRSGDSSIQTLFERNESELLRVIELLEEANRTKQELARQVRESFASMDELQNLADEVTVIARQTNMISINALVEAASAGDAGRGFAVVADEVRNLAANSAKSGRNISRTVEDISTKMSDVIELVNESEAKEKRSAADSRNAIETVMSSFKVVTTSLSESADGLRTASGRIQSEISQAMVSLQFQDRVSQILQNVTLNMKSLHGQFSASGDPGVGDDPPGANTLVDNMTHAYTTEEEKRIHQGLAPVNSNDPEVTFF